MLILSLKLHTNNVLQVNRPFTLNVSKHYLNRDYLFSYLHIFLDVPLYTTQYFYTNNKLIIPYTKICFLQSNKLKRNSNPHLNVDNSYVFPF